MNIKEFAKEINETILESVEENGTDYESEILSYYLDCMKDCDEVSEPDICQFSEGRARLSAYDLNDEAESLDLFLFIHTDTIASRVDARISTGFNGLQAFYDQCIKKKMPFRGAESEFNGDVQDAIDIVRESKGKVNVIRFYILTDGVVSSSAKYSMRDDEEDVMYEYNIWDIASIYRQDQIKNGNNKVEIDFENDVKYYVPNRNSKNNELVAPKIQCLKVDDDNPYVDNYVAIISGEVLAKVYNKFRTLLLEKNIRAFLRDKSKVNQKITKTIAEKPEMFLSYNNGISTTASDVELKPVGRTMYLTRLTDWQIVNGGQTTASIARASGSDKYDLSKVFVQMKISVVKNKEEYAETVKEISKCANSQTGIKPSDFESGDKYLIEMEKLSREIIAPVTNTKWFFERMRGQYTDTREDLGKSKAKDFKEEYPKSQMLTKLDVAKVMTIWNMKPHIACNSREKCFASYMSSLKKNEPDINHTYWHKVVALSILYKAIDDCVDKMCRQNGFRSRTTAYTMSAISYMTGQNLDLAYIWNNQKVQSQLEEIIEREVMIVNDFLEQDNSRTFTKNQRCWEELMPVIESHSVPQSLLMTEEGNTEDYNEEERSIIAKANAIDVEWWKAMLIWAQERNILAQIEKRRASTNIKRLENKRPIKGIKTAKQAIELKEKAESLGFKFEMSNDSAAYTL